MRVLIVASTVDIGGQAVNIKRCLARYGPQGWAVDAMAHHASYIKYPTDLRWDESKLAELYARADVVQHQNDLSLYRRFDGGQCKPTVLHHQGTRLRNYGPRIRAEAAAIGATELVSTVDLTLHQPLAEWLPAPHDLDWYARWRRPNRRAAIRIAHAPTARQIKGTPIILDAINRLSARYDIEFDLVERATLKQCLDRKGRADIFVDQAILGYGNNAIEAWAMGIPVVAGVTDRYVRRAMERTWGELPFLEATNVHTLYAQLERLILSKELRDEWGERGLAHVRRWHDYPAVAERLVRIYTAAAKQPSNGVEAWPGV